MPWHSSPRQGHGDGVSALAVFEIQAIQAHAKLHMEEGPESDRASKTLRADVKCKGTMLQRISSGDMAFMSLTSSCSGPLVTHEISKGGFAGSDSLARGATGLKMSGRVAIDVKSQGVRSLAGSGVTRNIFDEIAASWPPRQKLSDPRCRIFPKLPVTRDSFIALRKIAPARAGTTNMALSSEWMRKDRGFRVQLPAPTHRRHASSARPPISKPI
ncbi:hypothetical protein JHW43_000734 [Diplocarpon mali]|nr:hypothetical protein JHW43_000734 [Diplocarpon mali]